MRMLSVFNILAVAFLFLAAGMVIIPDAESRQRISSEVAAVRLLQRIAIAQHQFRSLGTRDANADGLPEFGSLTDLQRLVDLPIESTDRSGVAVLRTGGYRIAVLLPDNHGRPVGAASSSPVDPDLAARSFLALAWPTVAGRGARRVYAVHHELLIHEVHNDDQRIQGIGLPTMRLPQLAYREPGSERVATSTAWPALWKPFLEHAQATEIRRRLENAGLPVPSNILEITGPN